MAKGGASDLSKAQIKHDLEQLGKDLYNIDLQIQKVKSQGNDRNQIFNLKEAKHIIQKDVVEKQIQLELKVAQSRAASRARRGRH